MTCLVTVRDEKQDKTKDQTKKKKKRKEKRTTRTNVSILRCEGWSLLFIYYCTSVFVSRLGLEELGNNWTIEWPIWGQRICKLHTYDNQKRQSLMLFCFSLFVPSLLFFLFDKYGDALGITFTYFKVYSGLYFSCLVISHLFLMFINNKWKFNKFHITDFFKVYFHTRNVWEKAEVCKTELYSVQRIYKLSIHNWSSFRPNHQIRKLQEE